MTRLKMITAALLILATPVAAQQQPTSTVTAVTRDFQLLMGQLEHVSASVNALIQERDKLAADNARLTKELEEAKKAAPPKDK